MSFLITPFVQAKHLKYLNENSNLYFLGLPYAFKEAGLMEGLLVLTFVAAGSVKAMLLLIECKYKCLSVLAPGLSNVKVNAGKDYMPVKTSDDHHSDDDDDKHKKHNKSTR